MDSEGKSYRDNIDIDNIHELTLEIKNKNKDEVKQVIDEGKTFIDEVKDKTNKEKDSK